jgi:hypothetical protein
MTIIFATAALALGLAAQAQSGPAREGIVVRGSWTIDVRDASGKLVSHRAFENALTQSGRRVLGFLIKNRLDGAPTWAVELAAPPPTATGNITVPSPCGLYPCVTAQPLAAASGAGISQNLVAELVDDALVLSGSITATNTPKGLVGVVGTYFMSCSTGCSAPEKFSEKTIAPIEVAAGQIVQVKVVISFTSPTPPSTPQ